MARWWFTVVLRDGSGSTSDDAGLFRAVLHAGFDHTFPNKYKHSMAAALRRFTSLDPASLDLPVLAMTTSAIVEEHAKTLDQSLDPHASLFLACLRTRWPGELPRWVARTGALSGPEAAVLVYQAIQAGRADGRPVGDDQAAILAVDLGASETANLANMYLATLAGRQPIALDPGTVQEWIGSFDRWWRAGETRRLEWTAYMASRAGGENWRLIREAWINRLGALQIRNGPDAGWWPLEHHPLGKLHGTVQVLDCINMFYSELPRPDDDQVPQAWPGLPQPATDSPKPF